MRKTKTLKNLKKIIVHRPLMKHREWIVISESFGWKPIDQEGNNLVSIRPESRRNIGLLHQGKTGFNNMLVPTLNSTILLMSIHK